MKVTCAIAAILFALFAYWQLNDASQYHTADWGVVTWILTYALTAVTSLVTIFRPFSRGVYLGAALVALAIAVYRFSAIQWAGKILYNEDNPAGNESGGLVIVSLWMGFLAWKASSRPVASPA